jgi:hypothetical protein
MNRIVLILKRLFVSIGVVGTLYMLIGSQLYPYWYFQLIWLGKGLEFSYWRGGFNDLVFEEPYYLIAGAIGAFLLAFKLYNVREKFLPFVDRHWLWLSLGSIIVIGSIAVLNFQNNYQTYTTLKELESFGPSISEMGKSLKSRNAVPNTPIDFEYLDADTVERMYSQSALIWLSRSAQQNQQTTKMQRAASELVP